MSFDNPSSSDPSDLPDMLDVPVLAIRNNVIFPVLAFPINVGRPKSVRAVEEALATESKMLGIVAQHDPRTEDPDPGELYQVGTVVKILKMVKVPGNKLNVIIQGISRVKVDGWVQTDDYLRARLQTCVPKELSASDTNELMGDLRELAQKIIDLSPKFQPRPPFWFVPLTSCSRDIVSSNLNIPPEEKQELLETLDIRERMEKLSRF